MQAWREGGYSDDLILQARCSELGLSIGVPPTAIFPQWWVILWVWGDVTVSHLALDTTGDGNNINDIALTCC